MALTLCPECSHTVSDKAIFCPGCGYPMSFLPQVFKTKERPKADTSRRKRRKLPNGYGSIKKLSGNRSRPYAAYPPAVCTSESGNRSALPAIGYYKDWNSAYEALNEYHRSPYNPKTKDSTFKDVYEMLYKAKFEASRKMLSVSSRYAYESAFKNCTSLHQMRFLDIRRQEMQEVLDNCTLGYSSVCNLKKLFGQMYRFALENDIAEKDYAQFVTINQENDNEKGEPFSQEELELLWKNKHDRTVQMILIMIYSGFRIKAFETIEINTEEFYFKGGVKTSAGKSRIVPIHDSIREFSLEFHNNFPNFRVENFRKTFFYPTLAHLGISVTANGKKHTPHDCRHTFSWLCDKYKVDELSKHLLMGHSLGKDIEKSVYGHRTFQELCTEINKIGI
ncbi:MAG: integrase [Lachnospiraceae bacterium]|nr:integrase [Lachnospiraceae bacterium]